MTEWIGPKDLLESASSLMVALEGASAEIGPLRVAESAARVAEKKAEDELADARTMATVEVAAYLGGLVDPKTGRSNKEYTQLHIDKELMGHGEYQKAVQRFYAAKSSAGMALVALKNAADRFVAIRAAANLVAAMLYFLAEKPAIAVRSEEEHDADTD